MEAQEYSVRTSWKAIDPSAELAIEEEAIQLELSDAIAMALANNLGLRIERFQRAQSLFGVMQSTGIYDLLASVSANAFNETTPSASALDGADVRQFEGQNLDFRVDQLLRTGGTATLDWTNNRSKSNSLFSQINPSYNVGFDAIFSQPLLRGRGVLATERQLRVSRINSEASLANLELVVADTIEQVSDAYWLLVENREQLKVAQESLSLAEELHQMNTVQVEVGTKAPLELITSEAGIATRQEEIIRAQAAVQDAADLIRQLLNVEDGRLWSLDIVPATDPETTRVRIDLDNALAAALAERPEVENQRLQLRTLEIDSRFFRNQRLPQLDLQLRYGFNGLGGDVRLTAPGSNPFDPNPEFTLIPGGHSDALQQLLDADFEGWSVGVNFSMPIQNRAARAQSTIAELALEAGRTRLEEIVLAIRTEVRQAARGVLTAAQQIDSAGKSRELGERNLDAEQKRYDNGLSTSFQVLEIQEDLSQARSREVTAVTGYRRALTRFYKAVGRLAEEFDVVLEDDIELGSLEP